MEKEAKCRWCEGEAKRRPARRKSKCHQCGEIEVYGGNDFRNRCKWFVSASVANRWEWFVGYVLRSAACSMGGDVLKGVRIGGLGGS